MKYMPVSYTHLEELWVFDKVSEGMAEEIAKAKRRNMPIRYFDSKCEEVLE